MSTGVSHDGDDHGMLKTFFSPRTIAVVGATERQHAPGGRVLRYLQSQGFGGSVLPINPRRAHVLGAEAYPSREAVPLTPDLTVVAIPMTSAIDYVSSAGRLGDKNFVVFSAGTDTQRRSLQHVVHDQGLRLLGPNCVGYFNVTDNVAAGFSSAGELAPFASGGLAIVGQSGGVLSALLNRAVDRGLGISKVIATGDEVGIGMPDILTYLEGDPATRTVILYVESFRDGERFIRAARSLTEAGKRLIVLRGGVSPIGREAAATHTGGLSTDSAISASVLAEVGAVIADSLTMALDAAEILESPLFQSFREKRSRPNLGIVSGSGGGSVLATDAAYRQGLRLSTFTEETCHALEELLPEFASATNPLDVTAGVLEQPDVLGKAARVVALDPGVDVTVCVGLATSETTAAGTLAGAEAVASLRRPAVMIRESGTLSTEVLGLCRRHGVPVVDSFDGCMVALHRALYPPEPPNLNSDPPNDQYLAANPRGALGEFESLSLLESLSIPIPRMALVSEFQPDASLGYPLVLKASSPAIYHKKSAGLIAVGIEDAAEFAEALDRIGRRVESLSVPNVQLIVQELAPQGMELFAGVKRDNSFGPFILLGLGGSLVDRIGLVRLERAVVTLSNPHGLIDRLELPDGLIPRRARDRLADILLQLSQLALAASPTLSECDLNPIIVADEVVTVVDAKFVFEDVPE